MPEGDTVYRTARALDEALHGQMLTRFDVRVPRAATVDLAGCRVDRVTCYGKHILHHIGDYTLHSHLRMEGRWDRYRPGQRWRSPGYQARAVLATETIVTVGFELAEVRVVPRAEEHLLIDHLGPDPLKPQWDHGGLEVAAERLSADVRPVHVALLDQRNVAGFGNEYGNEICFLRGVDPHTPANQVDAMAVLRLGARMIRANRDRVERTTTGNRRRGERLYVCFRAGLPCRRCGEEIRFDRLGADATRLRDVYWCPSCQPSRG